MTQTSNRANSTRTPNCQWYGSIPTLVGYSCPQTISVACIAPDCLVDHQFACISFEDWWQFQVRSSGNCKPRGPKHVNRQRWPRSDMCTTRSHMRRPVLIPDQFQVGKSCSKGPTLTVIVKAIRSDRGWTHDPQGPAGLATCISTALCSLRGPKEVTSITCEIQQLQKHCQQYSACYKQSHVDAHQFDKLAVRSLFTATNWLVSDEAASIGHSGILASS